MMSSPSKCASKKKVSRRTHSFTEDEDKRIYGAWLACSIDAITGGEQSGHLFYKRVHAWFHEHRKYGDKRFQSDRTQVSIEKRGRTIQAECNKFCGAYEQVKNRPPSGSTMHDLVLFLQLIMLMFIHMPSFILTFDGSHVGLPCFGNFQIPK